MWNQLNSNQQQIQICRLDLNRRPTQRAIAQSDYGIEIVCKIWINGGVSVELLPWIQFNTSKQKWFRFSRDRNKCTWFCCLLLFFFIIIEITEKHPSTQWPQPAILKVCLKHFCVILTKNNALAPLLWFHFYSYMSATLNDEASFNSLHTVATCHHLSSATR